MRVFCQLV